MSYLYCPASSIYHIHECLMGNEKIEYTFLVIYYLPCNLCKIYSLLRDF